MAQRLQKKITRLPLPAANRIIGYVDGFMTNVHRRHGLGNLLFFINAAIFCSNETVLINTSNVLQGTANRFGKHRLSKPYTDSLLKNFRVVFRRPPAVKATLRAPSERRRKLPPKCPATSFVVRTFGQTPDFVARVPALLALLTWPTIDQEKWDRYKGVSHGTCVGVRAGRDFVHRPITATLYRRAFERLRQRGESIQPLFVLGDVTAAWRQFQDETDEVATQIDEDDVMQLAIARHCRNFVLSQSTFHVWMAYAAIMPRNIVAFNHTDPIKAGLHSPPWMAPWVVLQ